MLGYELIKQIDKITEDEPEEEYFNLLKKTFEALNSEHINSELIYFWCIAQLLKLGGHSPNLSTDTAGNQLVASSAYNFSFEDMTFAAGQNNNGRFKAEHIKVLRLLFSGSSPVALQQVKDMDKFINESAPLLRTIATQFHAV